MAKEFALNETPVSSKKLNNLCNTQLSTAERDAKAEADLDVGQIIFNTTTQKHQKLVSKAPAVWEDVPGLVHTHVAADVTDFDTQVRTSALNQMAIPTADLNLNAKKITNAADGTNPTDLVTKQQLDAAQAGLDTKDSVRTASTANIDLTTGGLLTIDGVVLVADDRVLVKDQTTPSQNGIYLAKVGAWVRAPDADSSAKVTAGMYCFVEEGTTHANEGWTLTTDNPITLGTTSLSFAKFTGGANHNLLSSVHADSLAAAVARGSIIVGNATPKWSALALGASNQFLKSDGTDLIYAAIVAGDLPASVLLNTQDNDLLNHFLETGQITAPANPAENKFRIFVDSADGKLKKKDSAGNVVDLEAGATGGEANTASNVGTAGVGVFKQKTGANLEFKKINSGAGITITDDTGNDEVDVSIDSTVATLTGAQELTNKKLTSPELVYAINAQTGTTYTFVLADDTKVVTLDNAAAITATIPPNSSVAYPIGSSITVIQKGAGQVTFAQGAGVTINSTGATPTAPKLRVRYSSATALKIDTDVWIVFGDIS